MGIPGPRTKFIEGSLINLGPTVTAHVDVCGRITGCRLCQTPIKSGELRFCIGSHGLGRKMKNGGTAFHMRYYYHPDCFSKYILSFTGDNVTKSKFPGNTKFHVDPWNREPKSTESSLFCVDCGENTAGHVVGATPRSRRRSPIRAWLSTRHPWEPLCEDCGKSDRWIECFYCGCFIKKHQISPMVESDGMICDRCADHADITTEKKLKRKARAAARIQAEFNNVKNQLEEKYYGE
jgi:hypothetical protein